MDPQEVRIENRRIVKLGSHDDADRAQIEARVLGHLRALPFGRLLLHGSKPTARRTMPTARVRDRK